MTDEAKDVVEALRIVGDSLFDNAADLIESLSAELEQVKRERDAAVESMRGWCAFCAHDERGKLLRESPVCLACMHNMDDEDLEDNWQWRGVKEDAK